MSIVSCVLQWYIARQILYWRGRKPELGKQNVKGEWIPRSQMISMSLKTHAWYLEVVFGLSVQVYSSVWIKLISWFSFVNFNSKTFVGANINNTKTKRVQREIIHFLQNTKAVRIVLLAWTTLVIVNGKFVIKAPPSVLWVTSCTSDYNCWSHCSYDAIRSSCI